MDSQEEPRILGPLAQRIGHAADAAQIAEAIVATWQEIEVALTPIIGRQGIATLYKRSLFLTASTYPWLAGTHAGVQVVMDVVALKCAFAQQDRRDASAGGEALLQTFYELLTSLVGASLTERLLRSVWANSSSAPPAQDSTP